MNYKVKYETLKEQIKELADYLEREAEPDLNCPTDYTQGLVAGHALAFKLCAKWIYEILEG